MINQNPGYPPGLNIISLESCSSTNDRVKQEWEKNPHILPLLVTSQEQVQGRGRYQRTWHSPPGMGLYSSYGIRFPAAGDVIYLPYVAAIAVAEVLRDHAGFDFRVKWPNDIVFGFKKIAGILIENSIHSEQVMSIIGIGINLNHEAKDFPNRLQPVSTSLKQVSGKRFLAPEINISLSHKLMLWIDCLARGGKNRIIRKINHLTSVYLGRSISFSKNKNEVVSGIFQGIDTDGALLIEEIKGKTARYYSGEIIS